MAFYKKNYLVFVGSGRTGSTLLGQLLNKHPNIAISSELRVITNAFKKNKKVNKYLKEIARVSSTESFVPHKYIDNDKNPQFLKWQKDWVIPEINFSEKYPKEKILIYGDKKQGGNTQAFIQDESKVWDLLSGLNLKFISINRHPYSILNSYKNVGFDIDEYVDEYIGIQKKANKIIQEQNGLSLYYEELLGSPNKTLIDTFNFLECNITDQFIEDLITLINKTKINETIDLPKEIRQKVDNNLPELMNFYNGNIGLNN